MAGTTDVVVRFIGDSTSVQNEVANVEKTGGKISGWAKGVGGAIAGAFAINAIKDFIGQASALQDAVAASGEVFGPAATEIDKFAKSASEALGMSKREATEAAITMGTFGKAAGLTGTDLTGFSTELVGLAGDLASFRGTSPEEAITALGGALKGETEGIRAYGVLLDEGTIKARAMSMGLVQATGDVDKIKSAQIGATTAQQTYNKQVEEFGEASPEAALAAQKLELAQSKLATATAGTVPDLTDQQKILATQAEVFAQTGDAQGDFSRTSDSAANTQKTLKADMENTQAALGDALLPAVQAILPYLSDMAGFVEKNSGWLVPLGGAILAIVAAVKIWTIAQMAWNIVMAANPIVLIILAIAALIAIIVLIVMHFDKVKAAAAALWAGIQVAWDAILAVIMKVWDGIKAGAQAVWDFMQTAWDSILAIIQAVWDWIQAQFSKLAAIITQPFETALLVIQTVWDGIKAAIETVWNWIKDTFAKVVDIITAPFNTAKDIISGVFDSIKETVGKIVGALKGPVNLFIRGWNKIKFTVPEVNLGPLGKIGGQTISLPHISELAKGGIVTRPTLAMVGEKGPEAVIPLGRGAGLKNIERAIVASTKVASSASESVAQTGADSITQLQAVATKATVVTSREATAATMATSQEATKATAATSEAATGSINRTEKGAADATVATAQYATAAIARTEQAATDAIARAAPAARPAPVDARTADFVGNLAESLAKIGRDPASARRLYDQARGDFLNLPKDILDAFRRAGKFFEDFAFRKFASGGIVTRPTLALIGEAGPEAVIPLGRKGGGGGGVGGNTYNVNVDVPPTADMAAIGRQVIDAIQAYERRNTAGWRKSA